MKYHMKEERLALYLSDDLSGADYRTVAEHLEACSECRGVLADLSVSHELLVGSFEEPTFEELTAVRRAVAMRIQARPRGPAWWIWTFAASSVVAIVILLANWRTQPERPPLTHLMAPSPVKISPLPAAPPDTAIAPVPPKPIVPGVRRVTLLTRADRPAWLKIDTADPNVVIIWQLNENEKVETQ
jgi:hypothetical protein